MKYTKLRTFGGCIVGVSSGGENILIPITISSLVTPIAVIDEENGDMIGLIVTETNSEGYYEVIFYQDINTGKTKRTLAIFSSLPSLDAKGETNFTITINDCVGYATLDLDNFVLHIKFD